MLPTVCFAAAAALLTGVLCIYRCVYTQLINCLSLCLTFEIALVTFDGVSIPAPLVSLGLFIDFGHSN